MKLRIERDMDAQRPAEWADDGCFLIANHRDFFVPPSSNRRFSIRDEIAQRESTHHVFGVEAYIHSGVRLALAGQGNFLDRSWDVSQVGVVFCSRGDWPNANDAKNAALSLISEWNQYLTGQVYGFIVETDDGAQIDSCWGFYGRETAVEEGQKALEYCKLNALSEACLI